MGDVYIVEHSEREHMQVTTTLVAACESYATAEQHIRCNVAILMAELPNCFDAEKRAQWRVAYNGMYRIKAINFVRNGSRQ